MLKAWKGFFHFRPEARLILMGPCAIVGVMPRRPDTWRHWQNFHVAEYYEEGISVYECIAPIDKKRLSAMIYRSVDFTVCSSRSEGFAFVVAENF